MKPMLLPQAYPGSSWAIATPDGLAAWFLLPEMVVIPSVKLSQTNDKHKMLICFLISGDLLLWQLPLSLWLFKSPLSMPLLDARNESLSFFSEVLPDPSFPPDSAQSWLAGSTLAVDHGSCPSDYAGLYSLEFMAHTFPRKIHIFQEWMKRNSKFCFFYPDYSGLQHSLLGRHVFLDSDKTESDFRQNHGSLFYCR